MKRIALMFSLFFVVALIFPANAPAPNCGDNILQTDLGEVCDGTDDEACPGECLSDCTCPEPPICGDGVVNQAEEVCDGADDEACPGECTIDCTCPPPPKCGDDMVNQAEEVCDGTDDEACPGECTIDCTCPEPGTCEPRTQGFWKRVCQGVYGVKRMHPETPEDFSDRELCADLMVREDRNLPCVRSASQIAALKLNSKYGILDDGCKVYYEDMEMTVKEVLGKIDAMNDKDCKEAADLAEAINSRDAL